MATSSSTSSPLVGRLVWVTDAAGGSVRVAPAMVPFVHALRLRAFALKARFVLTSGYRSPAEQAALYDRYLAGDPNVLYPPAKNSYHEYGLAVDVESNKLLELGQYAESIGMRWGGRFGDPVHFDLGKR